MQNVPFIFDPEYNEKLMIYQAEVAAREEGREEGREEAREETIELLIKSLLTSGMTSEDVSSRTGIDLETVKRIQDSL